MKPTLITISNRLSASVTIDAGKVHLSSTVGGLATGIESIAKSHDLKWVGWPGIVNEEIPSQQKELVRQRLKDISCHPVFLSEQQIAKYYEGFSNSTIWPLFHYFPLYTTYEENFWAAYRQVNEVFADAVLEIARPGDCIWIHDYQLMLLPQLIRSRMPQTQIGFFLHIPFPSFELFRLLPWRIEILKGVLGADLVGFHTYDYVRYFLSSAARLIGLEHSMGALAFEGRMVKADAFPMGIDYDKFAGAVDDPEVKQNSAEVLADIGDRKLIISIDRLDYTKGIIERLEAYDWFLTRYPQFKGKVTMILLAVPSRTHVDNYMELRKRLESLIGRVNGEHGQIGWTPVSYLYRSLPFKRLVALYRAADVALVTPLRDGMNLISKEFVATKTDGKGVLILSEMAGAASELGEALIVNARDKAAIVDAIKEALEMPLEEQIERNRLMQQRLSRYNVYRWASDFLHGLAEVKTMQKQLAIKRFDTETIDAFLQEYGLAAKRLIMLDYDGTLVEFESRPDKAGPDTIVTELLAALAADKKNQVLIISGRDKDTLTRWLGTLNTCLIAEHGAWMKKPGRQWATLEPPRTDWKKTIRPVMQLFADRTAGSSIEEKDFSLVWHYRRADPELAAQRAQELRDAIMNLTENMGISVFEGNKILEVKSLGVTKGTVARHWLQQQQWDFIFAAGDDFTDEDMFAVLPQTAWSVKVARGISKARFNVESVQEVRMLLQNMVATDVKESVC